MVWHRKQEKRVPRQTDKANLVRGEGICLDYPIRLGTSENDPVSWPKPLGSNAPTVLCPHQLRPHVVRIDTRYGGV